MSTQAENWFGQLIRMKRLDRQLTLAAAAARFETTKGYLCGIERGLIGPPSPQMTVAMAHLYGLDDETLVLLGYVEKSPELIRDTLRRRLYPAGIPEIPAKRWAETMPENRRCWAACSLDVSFMKVSKGRSTKQAPKPRESLLKVGLRKLAKKLRDVRRSAAAL